MRYLFLSTVLICTAALGGCNEGILNPQGPIAVAERQILFELARYHAGDRDPGDLGDVGSRILVSCVQQARELSA